MKARMYSIVVLFAAVLVSGGEAKPAAAPPKKEAVKPTAPPKPAKVLPAPPAVPHVQRTKVVPKPPARIKPNTVVAISGKVVAETPKRVEKVYTFTCGTVDALPTIRVALGKFRDFSISAGQTMTATEKGGATATVTIRIEKNDAAADSCAMTLELGPGGPLTVARVLTLEKGATLEKSVALNQPRSEAAFRRSIALGNVAGCSISAYVMPGRKRTVSTRPVRGPLHGVTGAPVEMFRQWVTGVKKGDLKLFGVGYLPVVWQRRTPEERTKLLQEYQQAFTTVLGKDFDPAKIKATYRGGAVSGKLSVTYGDKALPDISVRFLSGRWILEQD